MKAPWGLIDERWPKIFCVWHVYFMEFHQTPSYPETSRSTPISGMYKCMKAPWGLIDEQWPKIFCIWLIYFMEFHQPPLTPKLRSLPLSLVCTNVWRLRHPLAHRRTFYVQPWKNITEGIATTIDYYTKQWRHDCLACSLVTSPNTMHRFPGVPLGSIKSIHKNDNC